MEEDLAAEDSAAVAEVAVSGDRLGHGKKALSQWLARPRPRGDAGETVRVAAARRCGPRARGGQRRRADD
jgi:hypothetical protein